jgi:hypothetical protein
MLGALDTSIISDGEFDSLKSKGLGELRGF